MKKLLFAGLLFAASCGTIKTQVDSNKAPDFSEKISKLFILVKHSDNAKSFLYPFLENFEKQLSNKGITFEEYYLEPLSLETDEDIQKKIQAYGPNTVMFITQSETRIAFAAKTNNGFGGGNGFGGVSNGGLNRRITGVSFDVKIFSPAIKNPVWRANLKVDTPKGIKKAAVQANEEFVNKLIADNLVEGPPISHKN